MHTDEKACKLYNQISCFSNQRHMMIGSLIILSNITKEVVRSRVKAIESQEYVEEMISILSNVKTNVYLFSFDIATLKKTNDSIFL